MGSASKNFIDAVRYGGVTQPSHVKRFDPAGWEATFKSFAVHTKGDRELYTAGLWFFDRFRAVATKASQLQFGTLSLSQAVRLHCGLVNRDTGVVRRMRLSSLDTGSYIAEQIIQSRHEPEAPLTPAHPEDILEEKVDGLKFALDELNSRASVFGRPGQENRDPLRTIQLNLLLGAYYRVLVDLWNECLWNGWRLDTSGEIDLIAPRGTDYDISRAVSRFREDALGIQFATHLPEIYRSMELDAASLSIPRRLSAIQGTGKKRRLVFEANNADRDFIPTPFAFRFLALDRYFPSLLDREFPAYPATSLRDLLNAWEALYWTTVVLTERMPEDETIHTASKLYEYAPGLSEAELIRIVSTSLACNPAKAGRLLRFFTRERADKSDIWLRPLIRAEGGRYVPVVASLLVPNLLRAVEYWTSEGGLKLAERGRLFEEYARTEISDAIQTGAFDDAGVASRPLNIGREEIDIILWIGRTIVVAEAKCVLFATGPYEIANYFRLLESAARQAARKAGHVRSNLASTVKALGITKTEGAVVAPLVVVNSPLGAGLSIGDVPVVDLTILCRFFDQGYLDHFVTRTSVGRVTVGQRERFYDSKDEAEVKLLGYLKAPPHVRRYRESLTVEWRPVPPVHERQKGFAVGYLRVRLPIEPAKFIVEAPSHAEDN